VTGDTHDDDFSVVGALAPNRTATS
jgi:hypothetical protein